MSTTQTASRFDTLPDEQTLAATVTALEEHGVSVEVVDDPEAARQAVHGDLVRSLFGEHLARRREQDPPVPRRVGALGMPGFQGQGWVVHASTLWREYKRGKVRLALSVHASSRKDLPDEHDRHPRPLHYPAR